MDGENGVPSSPLPDRQTIGLLPPDVVNQIAAGEVVVRPSAALKELLENSLDAGAKNITITVRSGGLKLLQVCDTGKGIFKDDLPLLCQRFATSKLKEFEDLAKVQTFGFRGEALASISQVSRVSVLTKTTGSNVAFKAHYVEGELNGEPCATAGVDGTTITVEDMFYKMPTRRNALRAPDEYRAIVDVVARYSLRYSHVAFTCRRSDTGKGARLIASSDVRTEAGSSIKDNVRAVFGKHVATQLLSFDASIAKVNASFSACVTGSDFSVKKTIFILFINGRLVDCLPLKLAAVSAYSCYLVDGGHPFIYIDLRMHQDDIDVNIHPTKKEVRFLHDDVIIDAIVGHLLQKLKNAETSRRFPTQSYLTNSGAMLEAHIPKLETVASSDEEFEAPTTTRRQTSSQAEAPRMLLESNISDGTTRDKSANDKDETLSKYEEDANRFTNAENDDVGNVHDVVVEVDDDDDDVLMPPKDDDGVLFDDVLGSAKSSRAENGRVSSARSSGSGNCRPTARKGAIYAKDKVRIGSSAPVGLYDVYLAPDKQTEAVLNLQNHRKRSENALPMLTSIESMLKDAERSTHKGLAQILKEHFFVGASTTYKHVLLQHTTELLAADVEVIITELMYQQTLTRFSDHDSFHLDPPAPLMGLLHGFIENMEASAYEMQIDAESCATILLEKAPMLSEYYSISIKGERAAEAHIESLPLLLPCVMPDMRCFGEFLYKLAVKTDWSQEQACLNGIAVCISEWYGKHWMPLKEEVEDYMKIEAENPRQDSIHDGTEPSPSSAKEKSFSASDNRTWLLRHVLFASLRKDFHPPRKWHTQGAIREIASTSKLYKIFERC